MTNKEAETILHNFANLIEIHGLPDYCIQEFHQAYEMGMKALIENDQLNDKIYRLTILDCDE